MWLSLVERLVWDQDAAGSNPVIPTKSAKRKTRVRAGFNFYKRNKIDIRLIILGIYILMPYIIIYIRQ